METETEPKKEETQEPKATGIDILDSEMFKNEEDFGPEEPADEKKETEEASSTSTDKTLESAAGGQEDGTTGNEKPEEEPPAKEKSQEEPPAKEKSTEEPPAKDGKEPPETVPYDRFAKVIGDRNELREKVANLSGRFDAMEKVAADKVKTDAEKPEEEPADIDDPITLTKRELQEQIREEAKKLTPEPDESLRQEMQQMNLRMSERDARADHEDYDDVVYESGFFRELELAAKEGSKDAKETIREIFASKNPAGEMYSFACDVQGKTPPDVKDLNADDWAQVEPVLKKLGLNTTEDKWKNRRGKPKEEPSKKEKGEEEEAPAPDGDQTLRNVPSGDAPPKGAADDGEIDLDKMFEM